MIKSRKSQRNLQSVNFRADAVDQTHFPLKIWRRIFNQVSTYEDSFRYGEPFGEECLREQITAYLFQSRGVKADADSIIIGSSTPTNACISWTYNER